jgi:ABC-type sulfate transport system permease subunit
VQSTSNSRADKQAIVSGRVSGQTETAPLWVWREFGQFNTTGAYTASLVLALIAVSTLVAMNSFKRKEAA